MGDRTTLYLEVLASDRDPVVRAFGEPASEDPPDPRSPTLLLTHEPLPADLAAAQRWRDTEDQVHAHFAAFAAFALSPPPGR